jgi:hypothetical protein
MEGFSDNYIRVEMPYVAEMINHPVAVKLTEILPDGHMAGEMQYQVSGSKYQD